MTIADLRSKEGLLLDTNLLLLYVVGSYEPRQIQRFKRTQTFSEEDFLLLLTFGSHFKSFVTTPHILTEVTDLLESFNRAHHNRIFPLLRRFIAQVSEKYQSSEAIVREQPSRFDKFGLADAMTVDVASQNYLVLTDDLDLYGYLQNQNLPAYNFNHLRTGYLLS